MALLSMTRNRNRPSELEKHRFKSCKMGHSSKCKGVPFIFLGQKIVQSFGAKLFGNCILDFVSDCQTPEGRCWAGWWHASGEGTRNAHDEIKRHLWFEKWIRGDSFQVSRQLELHTSLHSHFFNLIQSRLILKTKSHHINTHSVYTKIMWLWYCCCFSTAISSHFLPPYINL